MRRSRSARFSSLAGVAAASSLALALLSPGLTLATDLHQSPPISWDNGSFQGSADECAGTNLAEGQVLWHFVLIDPEANPATLSATFANAGPKTADSYKNLKGILHFEIITGEDTLLGASTNVDGSMLNLSHICSNTSSEGGDEGSTPTPTPTGDTGSSTATPTPTPTGDSGSSNATPTPTPASGGTESSTATPTPKPAGEVESSTGTPKATVPPTSTLDEAPVSGGSSLPIALIGLSGLMTGLFIVRPSPLKIRNR